MINQKNIQVFYPNKHKDEILSKSLQVGTHTWPATYSDDNKSKLEAWFQIISLYHRSYVGTFSESTQVGYHCKLWMQQKRKRFGLWTKTKTVYYIDDLHFKYHSTTIGHQTPLWPDEPYVPGSSVDEDIYMDNIRYGETNNAVYWNYFYYEAYAGGFHEQIILKILDYDAKLYSRGVGEDNAINVENYSNY